MIDVTELYYYAEDSPSGLRWKINRYSGRKHGKLEAAIGEIAGKINHDGYWRCTDGGGKKGKTLQAHRVVWQLNFGEIRKGLVIDHIDGNLSNNKIDNLRCITQAENSRNTRKRKGNSTGVTGVSYEDSEHPRFRALVQTLEGKNKSKSFSITKYGYKTAFRLACEWRQKMLLELNTQGAGYTERHGK